jgi:SAM-dependent methyltransferase
MTRLQDPAAIRDQVREEYGKTAVGQGGCCSSSCCTGTDDVASTERLGYSAADAVGAPAGSNLGLGCGNPLAIASLLPGQTVLDLGSGAGFDCFLAADRVGRTGRVIGVDMTPPMIAKARRNQKDGDYPQVEFRLGEIEALPVADRSVDVIISNCVINLSPEKDRVFKEAFRVLRPGGRLAISDIVATAALPAEARQDLALYTGCIAGASQIGELHAALTAAGFVDVSITPKDQSRQFIREWAPGRNVADYVVSANITARKPEVA